MVQHSKDKVSVKDKRLIKMFKSKAVKIVKPIRTEEIEHLARCLGSCKNYHIIHCINHNLKTYLEDPDYEVYPTDTFMRYIYHNKPILLKKEMIDKLNVHNLPIIEDLRKLKYNLKDLSYYYDKV